jgi:hypothetical protein
MPVENTTRALIIYCTRYCSTMFPWFLPCSFIILCYMTIFLGRRLTPTSTDNTHKYSTVNLRLYSILHVTCPYIIWCQKTDEGLLRRSWHPTKLKFMQRIRAYNRCYIKPKPRYFKLAVKHVQIPMTSLIFFLIYLIFPEAVWPLGRNGLNRSKYQGCSWS